MTDYINYGKALLDSAAIKGAIALGSGFLLDVFGADLLAYEILFILVSLDTLTGVMVGWQENKVSSRRFFKTGKKLLVFFSLIIAAHQVSRITPNNAVLNLYVAEISLNNSMALFLAGNELLSILENAVKLGIPIPKKWKKKLESYIDKS